jgi:hypothetical protein
LFALLAAPAAAQDQQPPAPAEPITSTRLFWGPTARVLAPGQVTLAGYSPIFPVVQVGVTNRFQMGGGIFPFSTEEAVFWLTPKFQLHRSVRQSVAAGTLQIIVAGEGLFGLAYVNTTREVSGGRGAFTIGAGWAYGSDDDTFRFASGVPAVQIGGERRLSRSITLVTENYVVWGGGLFSGGIRFRRGRFSLDGALLILGAEGELVAAPAVNLAWQFR